MSTITHHFKDLTEMANWMDERAQLKREEARATKKLKERAVLLAEANVYQDMSVMLRDTQLHPEGV